MGHLQQKWCERTQGHLEVACLYALSECIERMATNEHRNNMGYSNRPRVQNELYPRRAGAKSRRRRLPFGTSTEINSTLWELQIETRAAFTKRLQNRYGSNTLHNTIKMEWCCMAWRLIIGKEMHGEDRDRVKGLGTEHVETVHYVLGCKRFAWIIMGWLVEVKVCHMSRRVAQEMRDIGLSLGPVKHCQCR